LKVEGWAAGPADRVNGGRVAGSGGGYDRFVGPKLLLRVEKSDRTCIQAVVTTDYPYLARINLALEDGCGGTQRVHNVFHICFDRCVGRIHGLIRLSRLTR